MCVCMCVHVHACVCEHVHACVHVSYGYAQVSRCQCPLVHSTAFIPYFDNLMSMFRYVCTVVVCRCSGCMELEEVQKSSTCFIIMIITNSNTLYSNSCPYLQIHMHVCMFEINMYSSTVAPEIFKPMSVCLLTCPVSFCSYWYQLWSSLSGSVWMIHLQPSHVTLPFSLLHGNGMVQPSQLTMPARNYVHGSSLSFCVWGSALSLSHVWSSSHILSCAFE